MDALATRQINKAKLPEKERALLGYVEVLTSRPAGVTDALTEGLRKAGWKDEEIFEASFITGLFAFFNRMSEAYGLGWEPGTTFLSAPPATEAPTASKTVAEP